MIDYKEKYLKYKNKYLNLKGGTIDCGIAWHNTTPKKTYEKITNKTIRSAIKMWSTNKKICVEKYGNISHWDTSNVTDMSYIFAQICLYYKFNEPLNEWDVSNVTNMKEMFSNASYFNQPLNEWDVSNVTNMESMFENAKNFNQSLEWDVSNVTNMESMFKNAEKFNQTLKWNTINTEYMENMFENATKFNGQTPISESINTKYKKDKENKANMFENRVFFNFKKLVESSDWNNNNKEYDMNKELPHIAKYMGIYNENLIMHVCKPTISTDMNELDN